MQHGPDLFASTFKMMAESEFSIDLPIVVLESNITVSNSNFDSAESGIKKQLPLSLEKVIVTLNESETKDHTRISDSHRTMEIAGLSAQEINNCIKKTNTHEVKDLSLESNSKQNNIVNMKDKENCIHTAMASTTTGPEDVPQADSSCPKSSQTTTAPPRTPTSCDDHGDNTEDGNAGVVRRAQEDGRLDVVFLGTVTQEGCCRFVSEILKCILYQRQQLPMTYDQLVYSQKKQQDTMQSKEAVSWRPVQSADLDWRKCLRTLQELEEVLQQLEALFSLSLVPRVLLLLGGSLVLPKEMYEINMEALAVAAGDGSLRVSSCLRQLFRSLFVADLLSDAKPVRLTATAVLVLAHRDCGVGWFRPKLDFKVPTRVKRQIIALSSDTGICGSVRAEMSDREDYVWFQAPTAIKGFSK